MYIYIYIHISTTKITSQRGYFETRTFQRNTFFQCSFSKVLSSVNTHAKFPVQSTVYLTTFKATFNVI